MQYPEHGIKELPRLSAKRHEELSEQDIVEIRDIPPDFPLSERQQIIRTAVLANREFVNQKELTSFVAIDQPIYHLDFETFSPAIPRFVGTSAFDAIPFLFSLHIEREGLTPIHRDYLHELKGDPRPQLAEKLVKAVGNKGAICTYGNYEQSVINELIAALPELDNELREIADRIVDLHKLLPLAYYHPDFRGSYSLKNVFPVLCPEQGYEDLTIADGRLASVQYMAALETEDLSQRKSIFKELRAYCHRDTLATLQIRQALSRMRKGEESE